MCFGQPKPHQLHWGSQEMRTAISCIKFSQVTDFIHACSDFNSSISSCSCPLKIVATCEMHTYASLPGPSPSFSSLAVQYCKWREAGRGPGNKATCMHDRLSIHLTIVTYHSRFTDIARTITQQQAINFHLFAWIHYMNVPIAPWPYTIIVSHDRCLLCNFM